MSKPVENTLRRTCRLTGNSFLLSKYEKEALDHFHLPYPVWCPEERIRAALSFRNDTHFFWRKCEHSGERIYSSFAPEALFPVVSREYWFSGDWDPLDYGRDYDFKRNFFEQLLELWREVPRPSLTGRDLSNSPAVHNSSALKDCYLVSNSQDALRCLFSVSLNSSRHCVDCYQLSRCQDCYECVHCLDCSELLWSEHCRDCHRSWFLADCRGCRDCLMCAGLEDRRFYVLNEAVGEEEFSRLVSQYVCGSRSMLEQAKETFGEFLRDKPVPHIYTDDPDTTTGNYLSSSRGVIDSFECRDSKGLIHCNDLLGASDCVYGCSFGGDVKECAQFVSVGRTAHRLVNCVECWDNVSELEYSTYCSESSNLFGCVGISGRSFCIFNRQYSEQEYRELKARIEQHLREQMLLGSPLPVRFSGYAYNYSAANDYMPLSKVPADMLGYRWDDRLDTVKPSQLLSGVGDITDRFSDVPVEVGEMEKMNASASIFLCEISGKPFQFNAEEIEFYKARNIAPPARAFEQRHLERVGKLSPKRMGIRLSSLSNKEIRTSFPPHWRRPVYTYREWKERLSKVSAGA